MHTEELMRKILNATLPAALHFSSCQKQELRGGVLGEAFACLLTGAGHATGGSTTCLTHPWVRGLGLWPLSPFILVWKKGKRRLRRKDSGFCRRFPRAFGLLGEATQRPDPTCQQKRLAIAFAAEQAYVIPDRLSSARQCPPSTDFA